MAPGVELSLRTVSRFSSSPRTSQEGDLEHCAHSLGLNGGSSYHLLVDNTIKRFKLGPSFPAPPVRETVTGESVPVCTPLSFPSVISGACPALVCFIWGCHSAKMWWVAWPYPAVSQGWTVRECILEMLLFRGREEKPLTVQMRQSGKNALTSASGIIHFSMSQHGKT